MDYRPQTIDHRPGTLVQWGVPKWDVPTGTGYSPNKLCRYINGYKGKGLTSEV